MILRKPYAFLIKHFKLMHLILSICLFYLTYRTGLMISYINDYIDRTISVVGDNIVGTLFNAWMIVLPILIIVFSLILLAVLSLKKKPRLFYLTIIIVEIAISILYIYTHSTFSEMEKTIVDIRTLKALRDLLFYVTITQSVFSIFALVRGVGFDIKKFDFGNDLHSLEISAEDNEEFEVALDFDLNDKKRVGNRFLRNIKYWIKEHKIIVNVVVATTLVVSVSCLFVNYLESHKSYSQETKITMNGFSMSIINSYIVNTDIKGNNITGKNAYLVVVDLEVSCLERKPKALTTGTLELNIAGDIYHHTNKYNHQLVDLGTVYNDQTIGNEGKRYLLVYEIPANASASKMKVGFRDINNKETTHVSLKLKRFSEKQTKKQYKLGQTVNFKGSTLGNTTLKINSYEIRNKFTVKYTYCTERKNCVKSVEYLTPNLFNSNYNKSLLKLEAELKLDSEFTAEEVKDLYGMVKVFAKIEYEIDGKTKYQNVYLGDIKKPKVKQENVYYIEVFQEIKIADKIAIIFTVRDKEYKYYLK